MESVANESNGAVGTADAAGEPRYAVPAVARALRIIELLASGEHPRGLTAIARELNLPKSSCFNLLSTLHDTGYITRHEDQTWSVTLKVYLVGSRASDNVNLLAHAKPILEALAHETGLTAHLGVLDPGGVVYAHKVAPPGFVRFATYPGKVASLHLTALSRSVLASLAPAERERLLSGYEFAGGTERAARNLVELEQRLERTRELGYAFEQEEETSGVCCVAASVLGHDDAVIAAIGVTGLTSQITRETAPQVGEQVMQAARHLSEQLVGPE